MAGRSIWKGYIHFRGMEIPVKLHPAVKEERIRFHLLHRRDGVRLEQQMICAHEKVPVPAEEQTRGYEVDEGKYILVDAGELKRTEPEDSRAIEVHEFVRTGEIDPIFRDRVYYLEPGDRSREYAALLGALAETRVEGICTWTMRKRSYVGALHVGGRILRVSTLRHADEVISVKSLDLVNIPLAEKELRIGSDLINQMVGPFAPEKFENQHEKRLQDLIDKKARGVKTAILRPRRLKPTTPDKLLQALEASLKKAA
jgi:DNA end-binding protein Ku